MKQLTISPDTQKKCLQAAVIIACIVPLSAGLLGMTQGAEMLGGGGFALDSHFRYLSGLLLGIGVCFLKTVPKIERHEKRFRMLTMIVVIGGMGRLAGTILYGIISPSILFALSMELGVTPLLCVWQHYVARRLGN